MGKTNREETKRVYYISPLFIIMVAFFVVFGDYIAIMSHIIAMIYHEFAHSYIAERYGYKLNKFKLMPYGASVSGDFVCTMPKHEIMIALAGPLSNFIVVVVGLASWWVFPSTYTFTHPLVVASFIIGVVNLLPVFPLDGGRIFFATMSLKFKYKKAHSITIIVGIIVCVVIILQSIVLMFYGGNITYLTLAIFMLCSLMLPDKDIKYERLYSMAFLHDRIKRGLEVRELMVCDSSSLFELSKMLNKNYFTKFIVVNSNMKIVYAFDEYELEEKILYYKLNVKVKEVDFIVK